MFIADFFVYSMLSLLICHNWAVANKRNKNLLCQCKFFIHNFKIHSYAVKYLWYLPDTNKTARTCVCTYVIFQENYDASPQPTAASRQTCGTRALHTYVCKTTTKTNIGAIKRSNKSSKLRQQQGKIDAKTFNIAWTRYWIRAIPFHSWERRKYPKLVAGSTWIFGDYFQIYVDLIYNIYKNINFLNLQVDISP